MNIPPSKVKGHPPPTTVPQPGLTLTAQGGLLLILVTSVLGGLLDGLFGVGYGVVTGLFFSAGCVFAALKTRIRDLPLIAVSPPLLFTVAVVVAETVRGWGSGGWFRSEIVALTMALAGDAFWIVAGTLATAVIAASRWLSGRQSAATQTRGHTRCALPANRDDVSRRRPP